MTTAPNNPGARRPLKGSWEAMLEEGKALAARDDDRAVAQFWRLVTRLADFPPERRLAGQGQLQAYLEEALFSAQSYLAKRGRFREAQELLLDRVTDLLDEDALSEWQLNRAKLLAWKGETEAAITLLHEQLTRSPLRIPVRWLLFDLYVASKKLADAETLVEEIGAHLQNAAGELDAADLELERALRWYLLSALSIEHESWEEAFAHFRRAAQESEAYADSWHMLYRPLVFRRQHNLANRIINREQSDASKHFWRGLNGYYAGDETGSALEWKHAAALDIGEVWIRSAADWILAHYYLGDDQRVGLELSLRLINRPQQEAEPLMLALSALGWALRGEWSNVRVNLDFALARYRESLQDVLLPEMYWHFAHDLLPSERFAEVEGYFRRPDAQTS